MSVTTLALSSARVVRTTTMIVAAVLLVALLAMQAFSSEYGQHAQLTVVDVGENDPALSAAVHEQEAVGLHCSSRPQLTDVVLFQETLGGEVTVMTFDQALAASKAKAGWVRRYCL